ncbi:MAG TPA: hypothetical protein VKE40_00960 [Gemmataceae bacterium]|nr:hypothetical protein [Gemmataceae bacterium]
MTCPPDVAAIVLGLLRHGLLTCRAAGWGPDPARCAAEADHLHNLPDLIADDSGERLRYYWDVERSAFAAGCAPEELGWWEEQWARLRAHVPVTGEVAATR